MLTTPPTPGQAAPIDTRLQQAKALTKDTIVVPLPDPCSYVYCGRGPSQVMRCNTLGSPPHSNGEYERLVLAGLSLLGPRRTVARLVFGDLRILDLREWRTNTFAKHVRFGPTECSFVHGRLENVTDPNCS